MIFRIIKGLIDAGQGYWPGLILPPRGHLAVSEDIFDVTNEEGMLMASNGQRAGNPPMHRTAHLKNSELISPKRQ